MVTREEYARLSNAQKRSIGDLSGLCEGYCDNCIFKTDYGVTVNHTYLSGLTIRYSSYCVIQQCYEHIQL